MIWFWGRWYYPMLEVKGCFSLAINCILFVIYMILTVVMLAIFGVTLLAFGLIFSPCLLLLLL